jgi:hypothetical protein
MYAPPHLDNRKLITKQSQKKFIAEIALFADTEQHYFTSLYSLFLNNYAGIGMLIRFSFTFYLFA